MARKSVFEILDGEINYQEEVQRINKLFDRYNYSGRSMREIVDSVFLQWKYRKTTISTFDLFRALKIDNISMINSMNEYITYCEAIINLLLVFKRHADDCWRYSEEFKRIFISIGNNVRDGLDKIGYKIYVYEDDEHAIIVENKPLASEAAEQINDRSISVKLMEYNRYLLQGNLEEKRSILKSLADWFEGIRKQLEANNLSSLASDVGFLLNTFNIRHNNEQGRIKNRYLKTMNDEELECWYDKTYSLIVASIISLEKIKIGKEVNELKKKVDAANKEAK